MPESGEQTNSAAQRNTSGNIRTEEPSGSLGQESTDCYRHTELMLGYRATYKYHHKRAILPGVPTHLHAQVRLPLLFKFLAQEGLAQSHQYTGTKDQLRTGNLWSLSAYLG